ncbi:MAG: DnaK-like molecular chaperone specific for IscU [Pseudomonadota bacterium]
MALLQISEPGKSTEPHQRRLSIGIDLGTTNSLVASMISGMPTIISDGEYRLIPSKVLYQENDVLVGHDIPEHKNIISSIKRYLGKKLKDIDTLALPFKIDKEREDIFIQTQQGLKTPVEISSEILKKLKQIATERFQDDIFGAVITVPAYFDEGQRQATKDAAQLAGINVLRLINEPTAAALAYGLDTKKEGVYAIYDLGGGTFDISILRFSKGVFEVLSTNGDASLGGDDFDQIIKHEIIKQNSLIHLNSEDHEKLNNIAKMIKEKLTKNDHLSEQFNFKNHNLNMSISSKTFENLAINLIDKTVQCVKNALFDADLNVTDIDGVVMVGGSTRMPVIQKYIRQFFKQSLLNDLNPDEVVALGAARQAQALSGQSDDDMLLLDVTPLSLGIETMGDLVEKIIPRNSTIPIAKAQEFTTYKDGQTMMKIHVVQGEREKVSENRSLAEFILKDIPPLPAGAAKVRVIFQVDADSMLTVSAEELTTGNKTKVEVKPSYGIDDKSIRKMLEDSFMNANMDKEFRSLAEIVVEANQIIELTEKAVTEDRHLLDENENHVIQKSLLDLKKQINLNDPQKIKEAIDTLNNASTSFAEKRMDHSVQSALSGKNINNIDY